MNALLNTPPFDQLPLVFVAVLLGSARMLAALTVFPLCTSVFMPPTVKGLIAIAFSLISAQGLYAGLVAPPAAPLAVWLVVKEVGLGALLGFAFGMVFWAVEQVGHIIDFQTGLTFTQTLDPLVGNATSVHARLLMQVFVVFFLAVGGLQIFLQAVYASYAVWPILDMGPRVEPGWIKVFSEQTGRLFALTALFAAPVLLVVLLVEFGFGLMNRAAPQLDVFVLTWPVKAWLATLVLALSLPYIFERALQAIGGYRRLVDVLQEVLHRG